MLPLATLTVDLTGSIVSFDADLQRKLGLSAPVSVGQHLDAVLNADSDHTVIDADLLMRLAHSHRERLGVLPGGGAVRWGCRELRTLAPLDFDAVQARFLILCAPLTTMKQIYEADAQGRLRQTVGSIIAGFAHEVRNPLAAIASLAEGVIAVGLDPELEGPVKRIPALVERVEGLLKTTMLYGRPRRPRTTPLSLQSALRDACALLADAGVAPARLLELPEQPALKVHMDAEHLTSILSNMIQNAIEEAGAEGVELRIHPVKDAPLSASPYCVGPVAALDVVDTGGGVAFDHLEQIFEPFFTTKRRGTGLGLALARDLARLNGGDLILYETSPQGSTFRLFMPLAPRPRKQATPQTAP